MSLMTAAPAIEQYDRCDWHLANWAMWMGQTGLKLRYPSRAACIGKSGSNDFDAMVANADTRCAMAVDAIIDDLPTTERLAVYHIHLAAVWRLRFLDACYARAKVHITNGLTMRGIW
jgi:hypothetical protein